MRTTTTYAQLDYEAVRALVSGLPPAVMEPIVGTGWRGFYEFGTMPDPSPEPSPHRQHPTMWAVWAEPQYFEDPVATLSDEVVSDGYFPVALLYQPGAPGGRRQAFFRKLREAAAAASDPEDIVFLPEGRTDRARSMEGWLAQQINIRFVGVG